LIGLSATVDVLWLFGGRRLYVPKSLEGAAGRRLAAQLGNTAARALIAARCGEQFDVPTLGKVERLRSAHALARAKHAGTTNRELTQKHSLQDRTIRRRLSKLRG
jgi:hypothetical protein